MSDEKQARIAPRTRGKGNNGNEKDEIASYAASTIKEMLGWYGLQDQGAEATSDVTVTSPNGKHNQGDVPLSQSHLTQTNGWQTGDNSLRDGANPNTPPDEVPHHGLSCSPPSVYSNHSDTARRHSNRKLVGMRYLFPQLGEDLSLYERATIWVSRHDHKYFVGYTEEQLQAVDSLLRPIAPITPELYKLHMNRSEYCRNVKLKYCLESEESWAVEFREKLKKTPSLGGFSGLCQVKIAAAELWRKYSENYKGHQARYPNPKSKFRNRKGTEGDSEDFECSLGSNDVSQMSHQNGRTKIILENNNSKSTDSVPSETEQERLKESHQLVDNDAAPRQEMGASSLEEKESNSETEDNIAGKMERSRTEGMASVEERLRAESLVSTNGRDRSESNISLMSADSESQYPVLSHIQEGYNGKLGKVSPPASSVGTVTTHVISPISSSELHEMKSRDDAEVHKSESRLSPSFPQRERSQSCIEIGSRGIGVSGFGSHPLSSHPGIPASLASVLPSGLPGMMLQQAGAGGLYMPSVMPSYTTLHDLSSLYPTATTASGISPSRRTTSISSPVTPASSGSSTPTQEPARKPLVFRSSEYKKSERGLSFLFPSLADQQLSLLDKVRITVLRHKHNYFLGWTEELLQQLDPLVRPKMVVTRQLYKEYCHRNAMKYDSNLQFALESSETWADEFRGRLTKPPSEGGFHSLCEVKQEAGRLWREFSGRYKMHNVVKSQMDMNNEVTAMYMEGDLKEDFSSRAKQKMGEPGDILTDPMTRARPRAISDLTDDRSARYRVGYMPGTMAAHRLDFSPEGLSSGLTSGVEIQRCRSPLNVSVSEDQSINISRRSSYVTSEESVSQGRSANSSPSPSSRSALSSPGPQHPPLISTAVSAFVTSRSANSSPLNVSLVQANLVSTLTGSSRGHGASTTATDTITALQTTVTAANTGTFRVEQKSRKRSFDTSRGGQDVDSRDTDSSPGKAKTSRIDSDISSPRDGHEGAIESPLASQAKRLSSTSSTSTSFDESVSRCKDLSPTRLSDRPSSSLSKKRDSDQPVWDDDLANTETLFKPLPCDCSVSEQLGIWMQRHRHNYFLNYTSEDLLQVQPRVRPQYLVTREVYRRFISEHMVSMFGKVNEILQSDMPQALAYQSKVDLVPADGGFSSIEEALTEALELWNTYVEGNKEQGREPQALSGIPPGWRHKREKAMNRTSTPESLRERSATFQTDSPVDRSKESVEGLMARERSSSWPQDPQYMYSKLAPRSKGKPPPASPWPVYATTPNPGSVGFLPGVGEFKVKQESDDPLYDQSGFWNQATYRYTPAWEASKHSDSTASTRHDSSRDTVDLNTEVLDLRRGASETGLASSGELSIRNAAQLSRQLWGCRSLLQKVLTENTAVSWHSRLQPYNSRLQSQLGPSYTCPQSTTDCMVDLLLATLDQQLSKL